MYAVLIGTWIAPSFNAAKKRDDLLGAVVEQRRDPVAATEAQRFQRVRQPRRSTVRASTPLREARRRPRSRPAGRRTATLFSASRRRRTRASVRRARRRGARPPPCRESGSPPASRADAGRASTHPRMRPRRRFDRRGRGRPDLPGWQTAGREANRSETGPAAGQRPDVASAGRLQRRRSGRTGPLRSRAAVVPRLRVTRPRPGPRDRQRCSPERAAASARGPRPARRTDSLAGVRSECMSAPEGRLPAIWRSTLMASASDVSVTNASFQTRSISSCRATRSPARSSSRSRRPRTRGGAEIVSSPRRSSWLSGSKEYGPNASVGRLALDRRGGELGRGHAGKRR